jgi:hypothetical protein
MISMYMRDGFIEIANGWTLTDDFDDLTDRIERLAVWAKENKPLWPIEQSTVKFMIERQIQLSIERGDFAPFIVDANAV